MDQFNFGTPPGGAPSMAPTLSFTQKPTRPAPPVPDNQLLLKRLMENPNFDYYQDIIHDYIVTDDNTWSVILFDIFEIISRIRQSANWGREKIEIVNRVNSGKRKAPQNLTFNQPHRSFHRPYLHPTPSASRVSQLRKASNVSSFDYSRSDDLSQYTDSVQKDTGSIISVGKTAPEGYRFYCPSRNCKASYARQGDYENHMDQKHAEYEPHDPRNSLKPAPQNPRGGTSHPSENPGLSPANNNNSNVQAPPFPSATPLPHFHTPTPGPPTEVRQPHHAVIPDLLQVPGDQLWDYVEVLEGQPFITNQNIHANYMPHRHGHYEEDVPMGGNDNVYDPNRP